MIFFDSFLGADVLSVPLTPTNIDNITDMRLSDGQYDDLYVTQDTGFELKEGFSKDWNFDTILHAAFDDNTLAGNLGVALEKISHLIIKRKKENDFVWTTIEVQEVKDITDMNLIGKDLTAEIGTKYQYAAVPVLNGIESVYSIALDKCESNNLIIADADETWITNLTDGFCDVTRTYPIQTVQPMYDKYPTMVRNTVQNYDVISVSGSWIPTETSEDGECVEPMYGREYDSVRTTYEKKFVDFLTNNKPKLLKNMDGRIWLCHLSGDVTDSADGSYNDRKISFSMTEVGNPNSAEDLWDNGFNESVTEEWW